MGAGRSLMRRCLVAAIGLILVAGCADQPKFRATIQDRLYDPSEFRHAAGGKPLYTLIRGNPLPESEVPFEALVLSAMTEGTRLFGTVLVRRPKFTTDSNAEGRNPNYNVALIVNGAKVGAGTACAAPDQVEVGPSEGDVHVRMVFCQGPHVLSTTRGTLAAVDDPRDPRFRSLISSMTRELFPQRDFRRNFDDDRDD